MGKKGRSWFKALFLTGYQPTQTDYDDIWDSFTNIQDDIDNGPAFKRILTANQSANYSIAIPFDSELIKVSVIRLSGTPVFSIGYSPGSSEIAENITLTNSIEDFDTDHRKYYASNGNIYVTVSGGAITSSVIYFAKKYSNPELVNNAFPFVFPLTLS